MSDADFSITFNKGRQRVDVFLWEVHPNTFEKWGAGRWGYFEAKWDNPKWGLFGEVHFVKSRLINHEDTVVHEFDHVRTEWMWANGITITRANEERMASFLDELVGKFFRKYRRLGGIIKK